MLDADHNNPGNLERAYKKDGTPLLFEGETDQNNDKVFRKFINVQYGYRALMEQLNIYFARDKNKINEIISIFAPISANNPTQKYIDNISNWTGLQPNKKYQPDAEIIIKLAAAISRQENGQPAIISDVVAGYHLL